MPRKPHSSLALAAALIVSAAVCIASHTSGAAAHPQDDGMSELSAAARGSSRRLLSTAVSPKLNAMAAAATALLQPKACIGGTCATADCTLRPALTEGPYWWNNMMVRRNITEGLPGLPLTLKLTVVNTSASATSCVPIAGAMVDVWHASADGVYSHFVTGAASASDTTTYLRGIQQADSNGLVTFDTVYPGWYSGRCTHLHLKVHIGGVFNAAAATYTGGSVAFTSQLFFNDSVTDTVATFSPYAARVNTVVRTRDSEDTIYAQGGAQMMSDLQFADAAQGYAGGLVASLTLGISTTGTGADASTGVGASDGSTATSAAPRAVAQPAVMSVASALGVVAAGVAMYGAAAARI